LLPLRELRIHQRLQLMAMAATLPVSERSCPRDALWDHCRNNLGIARLLVQEGRPAYLVGTACQMAVESAVRTALEHRGLVFDGDLHRALERLAAPTELAEVAGWTGSATRLAAAERAVGWVASWLRREAPERGWGF
jgi:hypothetical protein